MRRFALMACALMLLGAGGCAVTPQGTDRDMVDDWAMLAEARVPEPAVGDCWTTTAWAAHEMMAFGDLLQVDCHNNAHQMTTVHVGHVTGPLAGSAQRPAPGDLAVVYPECEAAAEAHLGGAWQTGLVYLYLHPATGAQWRGGARFFRCDVAAVGSAAGRLVTYKETFKDTLRPGGPLTIGCGNQVVEGEFIQDLTPVACTAPHDAEFVGFARQPAAKTWPADAKAVDAIFEKPCESRLLAYTGMSMATYSRQNVSSIWWMTTSAIGWEAGDRSVRCYLILNDKVSRSLKGVGNITI